MNDPKSEADIAAAIAVFQKDVGTWDAEVVITPGPGAPPIEQTAIYRNRIVGGRWLVVDYRTDAGFEGHGLYGWDAAQGQYTGVWADSMLTSIARCQGRWDRATRTMTFQTETTHAGRTLRYREIVETQADGTQLYRNLVPLPDGGEYEMIRTVYRRRAE